jgi:hypothetical protein
MDPMSLLVAFNALCVLSVTAVVIAAILKGDKL